MRRLLPCFLLLAACPAVEPEPDPCVPVAGTSWAVDDGDEGQIHPRSVRVGDALWTAYNRPGDDGAFGVFVVAHDCTGARLVDPVRLDDDAGNATDPDLAVSGDRVLVAWQADDGGEPWNLSVRTALLDVDGAVLRGEQRLAITAFGDPWEGQGWMARLAGTPGGWALAWARANEATLFQIAVQRLDAEGEPVGDAVPLTAGVEGAFEPTLLADGEDLHVAWQNSFDGSAGFGMAEVPADGEPRELDWAPLLNDGVGVALARDDAGTIWGAFGHSGRITVSEFGEAYGALPAEGIAAVQSGAAVAARSTGAAVAWFEGPANNADLYVRSWTQGGAATFAFDGDRTLVAEGLGAYPADVVAWSDDALLVTYAEGPSPGFRLTTEVVALP